MEANRPKGVSETQWAALCWYWDSEAGKKRCTTNVENRGKQLIGWHTAGTKSVARRDYKVNLSSSDGSVKSRYQRFIDIHTRKDGTSVDAASAEKIAQIRELESQATVESLRTGPNDKKAEGYLGPSYDCTFIKKKGCVSSLLLEHLGTSSFVCLKIRIFGTIKLIC